MKQAAQEGSGGPTPGDSQGQACWCLEQPALVGDVPAYCVLRAGRVVVCGLNVLSKVVYSIII